MRYATSELTRKKKQRGVMGFGRLGGVIRVEERKKQLFTIQLLGLLRRNCLLSWF